MTSKRVNPLLPFVLSATSVFADDVDAALEDNEFQGALRAMAHLEQQLGQAAFEKLIAAVAESVSEAAWARLCEAAQSEQPSSSGDASCWPLH